jgi:hypothetical protein
MRARCINEGLYGDDLNKILNNVLKIWDKWEYSRKGIGYEFIKSTLSSKEILHFYFPKGGWSDDFYVDVENYLKNYRIRNFGKFDAPFDWDWGNGDQDLNIFYGD